MRLDRFASEGEPQWSELEDALKRAGGKPERLGPDGVRRLARLYRAAAADLAQARRSFPGDPLVRRLESLVTPPAPAVHPARAARAPPAGPVVSASSARRAPLRDSVVTGYWRRVREQRVFLASAVALMAVPAV